jgi:hypothetical protein
VAWDVCHKTDRPSAKLRDGKAMSAGFPSDQIMEKSIRVGRRADIYTASTVGANGSPVMKVQVGINSPAQYAIYFDAVIE